MPEEYSLLMPFCNDDPNFAHGFQCGQIWEKCQRGDIFENYLVHSVNQKQVELICKRFLYLYEFKTLNDDWITLTAKLDIKSAN